MTSGMANRKFVKRFMSDVVMITVRAAMKDSCKKSFKESKKSSKIG